MGGDSQKVLDTKEKIKEAFFNIYKDKKIERISIKEITDKAGINRGTFYVYYKDIYDLLECIEDDIIVEVTERIKVAMSMIIRDQNPAKVLPPLEFFMKYSKYLRILLGNNGDPNFIHKIKAIAKNNIRQLLKEMNYLETPYIEYVMEYIASAQIGLVTYWMERDMELPIRELGDMIRHISMHGPLGYLIEKSPKI